MTYRLHVAPWVPDQTCPHPEMSGPMSRAYLQATEGLDDRYARAYRITLIAARRSAAHHSTYPDAYWRVDQTRTSVLTDTLVPMSDDIRDAYRLRLQADAFLREHCACVRDERGRTIDRCDQCADIGAEPDVYVHGHIETRPDRVAYRGAVRYRGAPRHRALPDRDVTVRTLIAHENDQAAHWRVTLHAVRIGRRIIIGAPGMRGSIGRRETIPERTVEVAHKARAAKRASVREAQGAPIKPGRIAAPWSMSARSLPRVWSKVTAETHALAALWVQVLTSTAENVPVTIGTLTITRYGAARVIPLHGAQVPMTNGEFARRAALAGIAPD